MAPSIENAESSTSMLPEGMQRGKREPSGETEDQVLPDTGNDDLGSLHSEDLETIYGYVAAKPVKGSQEGRKPQETDMRAKASRMKRAVKAMMEKQIQAQQEQQEQENNRSGIGLSRFKTAAQAVKMANRMSDTRKRSMEFWSNNNLTSDNEYDDRRWWERPVPSQNKLVKSLHTLAIFLVATDIVAMCVEGVSFADWVSGVDGRDADWNEVTPSLDYVTVSLLEEGSRTYQRDHFFIIKIVFGIMSDICSIVDVLLRFRLVDKAHDAIQDPKIISRNYLRGMFAFDVLTGLPFYWIFIPIPWVRLNRFGRLARLAMQSEDLITFFSGYVNMQVVRIVAFAVSMCIWVHVLSCLTCIIVFNDNPRDALIWMSIGHDDFLDKWREVYLRCTLWAWSQITNGQGDMSPQNEYQMIWTLVNQVGQSSWLREDALAQ